MPLTEAQTPEPRTEHAVAAGVPVRRRRVRSLQIGVGIAAVILGAGVVYLIRDTLGAFVLGALLAFLINPLVDRMSAYVPRALAIVVIFFALVAGLVGVASVFVPLLTTEIGQLQQQTPSILSQAQHSVERMQGQPIVLFGFRIDLTRQATNLDQRAGEFLLGQFGNALTISLVALNLLLQVILTLIVAFIAGFALAGILGMFIAIPVAATIAILFDHVYRRIYGTEP